MSSTDEERIRTVMGAVFDDVLAPLAQAMRARGEEPFPMKPDESRESYYVQRTKCPMTHEDFIAPSCVDFEDLEGRLAAHWRLLGRDELLGAVPRFVDAARSAYSLGEQGAEVSPLVYVMY